MSMLLSPSLDVIVIIVFQDVIVIIVIPGCNCSTCTNDRKRNSAFMVEKKKLMRKMKKKRIK